MVTATVLPENTTDKTVTWISSDEKIAKVDSRGNIIAMNPGKCLITAKTSNGKKASVELTVNSILVSEIKVDIEEISLNVDESVLVKTTVLPENATDKTLTWKSEDSNIATVEEGTIIAKAAGTTKVICESVNGITKEINVTVENIVETSTDVTENEDVNTNTDTGSNETTSNPLGTMIGLAAVVGVPAYIISKKKK